MKNEIIIDGSHATLGRIASYAAKKMLQGDNVIIVHAEKIIITGNRKDIQERYYAKRRMAGSSQKGPTFSVSPEKMLKKTIRGMLPTHRFGRGREAYFRVKCFSGMPKEYEGKQMIKSGKEKGIKHLTLTEVYKS